MPENCQPLASRRAAGEVAPGMRGCQGQFTPPRFRWSNAELLMSPAMLPGAVLARTTPMSDGPPTSSLTCDQVYDVCIDKPYFREVRNWATAPLYFDEPAFSIWKCW